MQISKATLLELLAYHYDRRERVYDFVAQMKPGEFTQPVNIGWSNMRSTLMHCLFAEEFWVEHAILKGRRPENNFRDFPDAAAVRAHAAGVRERTMAFVAGLAEQDLGRVESVTFSSGTKVEFTLSKAFLHLITHDAHHRGQVMAVARQLGYEPPEIDLM